MPIDLYYVPPSPPCRSVMLLARVIGVHLNLKLVDIFKKEQFKPEFIKLNPQHIVPVMDDNGFILCESRPIMGYLVNKYAKNDSLYPKDPKKRGLVDQRLYFDLGSLFENFMNCYFGILHSKTTVVDERDMGNMEKSCEFLNMFLEGNEFVAGDTMTIADISISTTICNLQCFNFDIGRYDNLAAWYERCKDILDKFGFDEVHETGVKLFTKQYRAAVQSAS